MSQGISKTQFKARVLEYFRRVQRTRRPIIITDRGKPVLKVVPYTDDPDEALAPKLKRWAKRKLKLGAELQSHAQVAEVGTPFWSAEADRRTVIPDRQIRHAVLIEVNTDRHTQRQFDSLRFLHFDQSAVRNERLQRCQSDADCQKIQRRLHKDAY